MYFWTDEASKWSLYIDDENKGVLTDPQIIPTCTTNDSILSTLIYVQLPTGKYNIEVKDENGNTKISEKWKLTKNSIESGSGTGGGAGGSVVEGIDKCMVIKYYD